MKNKIRTGGWILGIILIVTGLCLTAYALSYGAEPLNDEDKKELEKKQEILFESDLERVLGPGIPELLDYLKKTHFLTNACLKFGKVDRHGVTNLPLDDGYIYELKESSAIWGLEIISSELFGRKVKGRGNVFIFLTTGYKSGQFTHKTKKKFGKFKDAEWNEEKFLTMLDEVYEAAKRKGYNPYEGPADHFLLWYNSNVGK